MEFKYSDSTKGFYLVGLHMDIPEDAISITEEQHQQLLQEQSEGKIISVVEGEVVTLPAPPPSNEVLEASIRNQRDYKLAQSDWVVVKAMETATAVPQAWLDYRQALRDITEQVGFPTDVTFPTPPEA